MGLGDIVPRGADFLIKWLKRHDREIAQLRTARVGNKMTVDGAPGINIVNGGGVTVYNGGAFKLATGTGQVVVFAGQGTIPDGSGRVQQVFQVGRDDGTTAFYVSDTGTTPGHAHQQAWAMLDRAQNIICAEDTVGGVGLARPYIPLGTFVDITAPAATTTSTSFTALQWGHVYQQHPRVFLSMLAQTSAGTTGQLRLTVGGVQVGIVSVGAGTFGQVNIGPVAWPSTTYVYLSQGVMQIEGKVTGGTGSIGVRCLGAWGMQS